jgi:hypothetical protein
MITLRQGDLLVWDPGTIHAVVWIVDGDVGGDMTAFISESGRRFSICMSDITHDVALGLAVLLREGSRIT